MTSVAIRIESSKAGPGILAIPIICAQMIAAVIPLADSLTIVDFGYFLIWVYHHKQPPDRKAATAHGQKQTADFHSFARTSGWQVSPLAGITSE